MQKTRFHEIATDLADLLDRKREAYGNNLQAAPVILEQLYPDGVKPSEYPTLLLVVRIIDKLSRLANGSGRFALGEDAWKDIAGYAMCALHDFEDRDE